MLVLAERGETLDWPMSLDAALDVVDPLTRELEAFFWFADSSGDFLEALEEALIQLSSEEQEDVSSFLEATEEEDLKADLDGGPGFDTIGRILLEIVTLEAKGESPCLVLLTSTEALTLLLSPVDGLEMDVLCSFAATACRKMYHKQKFLIKLSLYSFMNHYEVRR